MKKRFAGIFVLIFALCIFFCCAINLEDASVKTTFTKDELLEDYDYMWQVLEKNYLYFAILEERGVDVAALKESSRRQLEERITDVEGFYSLLGNLFGRMQYFAHLNVLDTHGYEIYEKYYSTETEEAQISAWGRTVMSNAQTRAIYDYLKNGSLSTSEDLTGYGTVGVFYDEGRKAVTFTMSTFDNAVVQRDKNVIEAYLNSLNGAPVEHIIFDITGNPGGDGSYWRNNIVMLFDGVYEWDTYWYLIETELTQEYFFENCTPDQEFIQRNSLIAHPVSELLKEHEVPSFVEELGLTHYIKAENMIEGAAVLNEEYLDAKRWVLIDGMVYSAAESFAIFCKETDWATLVGRSTMGDGGGSDPVMFALPNTGLLVRFRGCVVENYNGQIDAEVGTPPDVVVDVMESIQAACNRMIDEENR